MARFRRGSLFVRDAREHSRPYDRNQVARILYLAERLEVRTKPTGKRNGAIGLTGLAVLRVLLLRFFNRTTGLCCPSYDALEQATGFCRQTIATVLDRLERAGLINRTRRLVRELVDGIVTVRQASNLYSFAEPQAVPLPRPAPVRPFPQRGILAQLAATATHRAKSTQKPVSLEGGQITYWKPVIDARSWRDRARSALQRTVGEASK